MGLELTIGFLKRNHCFNTNRLTFDTPELVALIRRFEAKNHSVPIKWETDEATYTSIDHYGMPLTYVFASHFAQRPESIMLSDFDSGILALLSRINPTTKIVLYWH